MNMNELMQYTSYLLVAIGAMAFFVSVITQVVKSLPRLNALPTSLVVFILSMVLCPLAYVALMAWQQQPVTWYFLFACLLAAFIVALVAMDGWERLKEIWNRTGYKKK